MSRPRTPAEMAAIRKAKKASPWSRFANCDTAKAQRSHIRYLKMGKKHEPA